MIDVLRVILAIILLFFLPGFLLIQALFPKKNELDEEEDMLYRIVLGMAMSVVISILVGFFLASISPIDGGKGYFDAPYIVVTLLSLCTIFFVVGWYRGAYPFLGRSAEPIKPLPIPRRNLERIQELLEDWKVYRRKILEYEEIIKSAKDEKIIRRYMRRREKLLNRLKEIDLRIKFLSDVKVRDKEGEEILEQLQEYIYQWRKLREKIDDLEIKLAIAISKGEKERERYLIKKRGKLIKKIEELDRDIMMLKEEIKAR